MTKEDTVYIPFSPAALQSVEKMAQESRLSVSEVIRVALSQYRAQQHYVKKGYTPAIAARKTFSGVDVVTVEELS